MKLKITIIFILSLFTAATMAESRAARDTLKHEVRVGWGDQLFETLVWRNQNPPGTLLPDGSAFVRNENYRYSQHIFAEYQYRFNKWFSLGGMFDGSGVTWRSNLYDKSGKFIRTDGNHNFYNLVIMPTVQFTYLYHEYVSLHSGIGVGLNINGGSEQDIYGNYTVCALAVDITYFGVTVGHGHWYGSFDLGGLYSMKGQNVVFMASSKIFRAAIGARF